MTIIAMPALALTAKCTGCGQEIALNQHAAKYVSAGKPIYCPACRRGGDHWTKENYTLYLETNHWKLFRQRVLKHYGRKCYLCGRADAEIHIHHNDYSRLGGELMSDVIPLCAEHHRMFHDVL